MLYLLSPAKSLDYDTPVPAAVRRKATDPLFVDRRGRADRRDAPQTPAQVAALMDLSDNLAQLNVGRYGAWQPRPPPLNSKPALLAFDGDVYAGLQAAHADDGRPRLGAGAPGASCRACTACCARWTGCSPTGWRWASRCQPAAARTCTPSGATASSST
jgi:hypothetical protein